MHIVCVVKVNCSLFLFTLFPRVLQVLFACGLLVFIINFKHFQLIIHLRGRVITPNSLFSVDGTLQHFHGAARRSRENPSLSLVVREVFPFTLIDSHFRSCRTDSRLRDHLMKRAAETRIQTTSASAEANFIRLNVEFIKILTC